MRTVVLGSASPRRKLLLEQIGIHPVVRPAAQSELVFRQGGMTEAQEIAKQKGLEVAAAKDLPENALVLAADTMVVLAGNILGKPNDFAEAEDMLRRLSGQVHQVITGIFLLDTANGKSECTYAITEVEFKNLSQSHIHGYIASGEGWDKAGGYAIQGLGAVLVNRIEGSYSNVVGLPLETVADLLEDFGYQVVAGSNKE